MQPDFGLVVRVYCLVRPGARAASSSRRQTGRVGDMDADDDTMPRGGKWAAISMTKTAREDDRGRAATKCVAAR